jgi:molybdate/tungstate transport system ATP-binding protein
MLELKYISKQLGDFMLNNVSFRVEESDYFMLMGMSGSGKTVLLETIAGLIKPDRGEIIFKNKNITNEKIQKRNIPIVFQNASVFPHLTVYQNIAYPLQGKKISVETIRKKVNELAEITAVTSFLKRKPKGLSGGELQRVALARALALEPHLLLLDEPLSSLDALLRSDLRSLLRKINKMGTTIIHVTHDYNEAILLANKVGVIENGNLQQVGNPEDIFMYPQSEFVAGFVGVPNFFAITSLENSCFRIADSDIVLFSKQKTKSSHFISISQIAFKFFIDKPELNYKNVFRAKIIESITSHKFVQIVLDIGVKLIAELDSENMFVMDKDEIWISILPEKIRFIDKK